MVQLTYRNVAMLTITAPKSQSIPLPIRSPLLTTEEISRWLGVSPRTICLWAECQEIPALKIGRHWRFDPESLTEWLTTKRGGRTRSNAGEVPLRSRKGQVAGAP